MPSLDQMLSLLPQWMALQNANSQGHGFLSVLADFLDSLQDDMDLVTAGHYPGLARLSTAWLGYRAPLSLTEQHFYHFAQQVPAALPVTTLPIRTLTELHDFHTALDPVAYLDTVTDTVFFNNLLLVEALAQGRSDGAGSLVFSLGFSLEAGTFVQLRQKDGSWTLLQPYWGIDYMFGMVTVPEALLQDPTAATTLRCSPAEESSVAVTCLELGHTLPVLRHPIWNYFDDLGLLLGIERLEGEDNYQLRGRLLDALRAPANATYEGLMAGVGRGLALASSLNWTGHDPLTISGGTEVLIQGLREIETVEQEALAEIKDPAHLSTRTYQFLTLRPVYLDSYEVFVNGKRYYDAIFTTTVPVLRTDQGAIASCSSVLDLSGYPDREHIQTVTCTYSYRSYLVTAIPDTADQLLTPYYLTRRSSQDPYRVTVISSLTITRLGDAKFIDEELMAGTPTDRYYAYAEQSLRLAPVTIGYARWGQGVWFSKEAPAPQLGHVPSNWDQLQAPQGTGEQIWRPGVGGEEDLSTRLVRLADGSIVPALHFGYYYLGTDDPIAEHYLFVNQATATTASSPPNAVATLTLSTPPILGAPMFASRPGVRLTWDPLAGGMYHVEVHALRAGEQGAWVCTLDFPTASPAQLRVAVQEGDGWGDYTQLSDTVLVGAEFTISPPTALQFSEGQSLRLQYLTTDSFGVVRDADHQLTGKTIQARMAQAANPTLYYESAPGTPTEGLEAHRPITGLDLRPLISGARTGFLFLDTTPALPARIQVISPFAMDEVNALTPPSVSSAPCQYQFFYTRGTADLAYTSLVFYCRVVDRYGDPVPGATVQWFVSGAPVSSVTDLDGVAALVVPDSVSDVTPFVAVCGSLSVTGTLRSQPACLLPYMTSIQTHLAVDAAVDGGAYYLAAWAHLGGIPRATGTLSFQARPHSASSLQAEWQDLPVSMPPNGPQTIPTTPPCTVGVLYTPPQAGMEVRAVYIGGVDSIWPSLPVRLP